MSSVTPAPNITLKRTTEVKNSSKDDAIKMYIMYKVLEVVENKIEDL